MQCNYRHFSQKFKALIVKNLETETFALANNIFS